jgi:hypothetical protein
MAQAFVSADDASAIARARGLFPGRRIEIWLGARRVYTSGPGDESRQAPQASDGLDRVGKLREQAKLLRDVAAGSAGFAPLDDGILDLARQCDELADTLAQALATRVPERPNGNQ